MNPDLDWRRIDVTALITDSGIATVQIEHLEACRAWLRSHDYTTDSLDLAVDVAVLRERFDQLFHWQEEFGYRLSEHGPGLPGLDALRDGFEFSIPVGRGHVLEVHGAETFGVKEPYWFKSFLSIISEHSRLHLYLGSRFFALFPLSKEAQFDQLGLPFSCANEERFRVP